MSQSRSVLKEAGSFNVINTTGDYTLPSVAGSVIINAGEAVTDAIQLNCTNVAGGIDLNCGATSGDFDLDTGTTGDIDINCGTGGITIDSTGTFSIDSSSTTVASNVTTVGAAGFDLTVNSTAGSLILSGGEGAVDAITMNANTAGGGIDINCVAGGITIDTTGAFSIDSTSTTVASNVTTVGAAGFDLTVNSTAGSLILSGGEGAVDAITMNANTAGGGIDINCVAGGITIDTTGAFSIDSTSTTVGSNVTTVGAAGFDLTVNSTAGSVIVNGAEAAGDAVQLTTAAGGITCSTLATSLLGGLKMGTFIIPCIPNVIRQVIAAGNPGALSVATFGSDVAVDAGGDAFTIANGTQVGQLKMVTLDTTAGGTATITTSGSALADGTTITLTDAKDFVVLMWNGTAWRMIGGLGVTVA